MTLLAARRWHLLTAATACGALALQLILVISGAATLVEENAPSGPLLGVARFASYFTIQSNCSSP